MPVRRSSRLTARDKQESINIQPPAIAEQSKTSRKRKAAVAKAEMGAKKEKIATKFTDEKGKSKGLAIGGMPSPNSDFLSSLPAEILGMIIKNITDSASLSKLSRTCQRYYSLASPQLYKRIAVAAMFHAHIAKLIRTLEPHLTIAQARQLKKEGTYKGQSQQFSRKLDQHTKPACSDYVQQIVIGVANPGRKHDYIVHRYVEEALKNMENLEIVETRVLTESIAQTLAGLQRLQALNLIFSDFHDENLKSLTKIKNLKHLTVEESGYGGNSNNKENVVQSLLLNSRSTLRSLALHINPYNADFLDNWEEKLAERGAVPRQKFDFSDLNSFTLTGASLDSDLVILLARAVNFVGLRELALRRLHAGKALLFEHLTTLLSETQSTATKVKLQTFTLDLSVDDLDLSPTQRQAIVDSQCRLISSFDTLTSLELEDYNQYPREVPTNPGLSNTLLQAILKHQNLTKLKISYLGIKGGYKIPYLSPTTVTMLVTHLLELKEIEFAPEEDDIDLMGRALARSTSLTSISLSPTPTWASIVRPAEPGLDLLNGILKGFISRNHGSSTETYKWEDHCDLRCVSVDHRVWEIASKFRKGGKGVKKAERFILEDDRKREVMYREITGSFPVHIHVGYDPGFEWVDQVSKDVY